MRGVHVVGLVLLVVASAGVAAANQPPMAEAGLDQEAVVNQTVYLDAGGSLDPDGRVVDYTWSIETPRGNTTVPGCASCVQTRFVPRGNGTYAVTVTVTDDTGASMADTMYVNVAGSTVPNTSGGSVSPGGSDVSVPAPSVSSGRSGAAGGGAGGALVNPSRIVRNDAGEFVLTTGDGATGDFIMMVGGERVAIPGWRMDLLSLDDGKVTYDEASRHFRRAGATRDDVRGELQNSRRSCGSYVCTSRVHDTSGEVADDRDKSIDERAEELLGCTRYCTDEGNSDGDESSESPSSDGEDDSDGSDVGDINVGGGSAGPSPPSNTRGGGSGFTPGII